MFLLSTVIPYLIICIIIHLLILLKLNLTDIYAKAKYIRDNKPLHRLMTIVSVFILYVCVIRPTTSPLNVNALNMRRLCLKHNIHISIIIVYEL